MIGRIKSFYGRYAGRVNHFLGFAQACTHEIVLLEKARMVDYVHAGLTIRSHYQSYYSGKKVVETFDSSLWEVLDCGLLRGPVVWALEQQHGKSVRLLQRNNQQIAQINVGPFEFSWITGRSAQDDAVDISIASHMFVTKGRVEEAIKFCRELLWGQFTKPAIVLGTDEDSVMVKEDLTLELIRSSQAERMAQRIKKFLDAGINRSILFYGPPGSGKSNLVKGIAATLGFRTVRFESIGDFSTTEVVEIIDFLDPHMIIMEDLDHMDLEPDMLDKVEHFYHHGKMVFGTANQAHRLNDALLRAGRFSETIEIRHLDEEIIRRMVENDEELYEIAKEMPAAFIKELMNRVKAVGKAEALATKQDIDKRIEKMNQTSYELLDSED